MSYTNFGEKTVDPDDYASAVQSYDEGFVYTRTEKGHMERVRSLRIYLPDFELSSENRRILRKFEDGMKANPVPYEQYTWHIHKLGKDFYDTKFGDGVFSANKIKELFTTRHTNFNEILTFAPSDGNEPRGYCIAYVALTDVKIVHYAYPFYSLELINSSYGIYMMTKAIESFKAHGYTYVYLGSVHETASLYKLQFKGAEWWDEQSNSWNGDIETLKSRVRTSMLHDTEKL